MADTPRVEKRQINVRLPVALVAEIDERRATAVDRHGDPLALSRDEMFTRMLLYALKHGPKRPDQTRHPITRRTP